jgi:hypothetical protein
LASFADYDHKSRYYFDNQLISRFKATLRMKHNVRQLFFSPGFWGALLLGTVIVWASFYNLANYPSIWWDEAIFSETAANVVQHGRYAFTVQSPNQLSDFDFRISAGPAIRAMRN